MVFTKEIFESIFSHQSSFVYILDSQCRVQFANKKLLETIKKNESDVLGKTILEVGYEVSTATKLQAIFDKVLQGEIISGIDIFSNIHRVPTYYEFTFSPIKDAQGKVAFISAVCHDISNRKEIESQLQVSVAELKKERELRESFIMAMTHDLRTPLTSAKLSAQIIQRHPKDENAIQKFSGRIVENVERTDAMIRDLLDSMRLKAGEGIPLNIQPAVMNAILESAIEEHSINYGKRFNLQMNEMVKGSWDSGAIRRVIDNLLTNAVKYGSVDKPITVKLFKESTYNCISVHNEGSPLNQEEMSDLFVPFKRMKNAHDSGQKGWGIGLTLVLGLVRAHNGDVDVESLSTTGTTFTIKLPQ